MYTLSLEQKNLSNPSTCPVLCIYEVWIYPTHPRVLSCVYIKSGVERSIQPVHMSCPPRQMSVLSFCVHIQSVLRVSTCHDFHLDLSLHNSFVGPGSSFYLTNHLLVSETSSVNDWDPDIKNSNPSLCIHTFLVSSVAGHVRFTKVPVFIKYNSVFFFVFQLKIDYFQMLFLCKMTCGVMLQKEKSNKTPKFLIGLLYY